jgi:hypothetical protein
MKLINRIRSFLSMKRKTCLFIDKVSNTEVFLYVDCYGVEWMASYCWSDRMLRVEVK